MLIQAIRDDLGVFRVRVVDPVPELAERAQVVDAEENQVGRIEAQPQAPQGNELEQPPPAGGTDCEVAAVVGIVLDRQLQAELFRFFGDRGVAEAGEFEVVVVGGPGHSGVIDHDERNPLAGHDLEAFDRPGDVCPARLGIRHDQGRQAAGRRRLQAGLTEEVDGVRQVGRYVCRLVAVVGGPARELAVVDPRSEEACLQVPKLHQWSLPRKNPEARSQNPEGDVEGRETTDDGVSGEKGSPPGVKGRWIIHPEVPQVAARQTRRFPTQDASGSTRCTLGGGQPLKWEA